MYCFTFVSVSSSFLEEKFSVMNNPKTLRIVSFDFLYFDYFVIRFFLTNALI